jgi:site-specific DNA-methyltransferase (adenine-specific)
MPIEEICALPIKNIMEKKSVIFMWATGARMNYAFDAIKAWGLHYAGVQYIWVKVNKHGNRIIGQGPMPKFNKNYTEYVLSATTNKRGRPFPTLTMNQDPMIFDVVRKHSQKPPVVRERIIELCGDLPRIELFATERTSGWDCTGYEVDGVDIRDFLRG